METRECKFCGESFQAADSRIRYCEPHRSMGHAVYERVRLDREKAERANRFCADCGAKLTDLRGGTKRCHECRAKHEQERRREYQRNLRLRQGAFQGVDKICQRCGSTFVAGRKDAKWCPPCKVILNGGRVSERGGPGNWTLNCSRCGQPYEAQRSDARWCDTCKPLAREEYQRRAYEQRHQSECIECGALIARRSVRCRSCSARLRNYARVAENSSTWKGGTTRKQDGYIFVRVKFGKKGKYRGQHILVWEDVHGHPLPKGWVVHHLNGIKDDNRPENLAGMPRHEHHKHPREALRPYEERIRLLEEQVRELGVEPKGQVWVGEHHGHHH